jgi:hypothetical protein
MKVKTEKWNSQVEAIHHTVSELERKLGVLSAQMASQERVGKMEQKFTHDNDKLRDSVAFLSS